MAKYPIDLTGFRFGRLIVLSKNGVKKSPNGRTQSVWLCKCDCGVEKSVGRVALVTGCTQSCGCLCNEVRKEKKLSPIVKKLHSVFHDMKARCYNPKHVYFKNYGGRGIKVCQEWLKNKDAFVDWALNNGYSEGLTIERLNVDGDYCPENCSWIPRNEQALNRRNTIRVLIDGKEYTTEELSKITNLSKSTLFARIKRYNFSGRQIIDTPKNAKVRVG